MNQFPGRMSALVFQILLLCFIAVVLIGKCGISPCVVNPSEITHRLRPAQTLFLVLIGGDMPVCAKLVKRNMWVNTLKSPQLSLKWCVWERKYSGKQE